MRHIHQLQHMKSKNVTLTISLIFAVIYEGQLDARRT